MSTIPNTIQCRINVMNVAKTWIKNNPNANKRQIAAHQRVVDVYTKKLAKLGYRA